MPHCIVEYSSTLPERVTAAELLSRVHHALHASGLFAPAHIKSRAQAYDVFVLDEQIDDFIHVTVRLHQGRSQSQKQDLSSAILQAISQLPLACVSVTVDIVEMDSAVYAKHVFGERLSGNE